MEHEALSAMEKKAGLSWLLAFYGEMLTDTQREMAHLYWEEDYSLAEIAAQFSVSRQSVHDTVSRTEKQLQGLEEKLGMLRRFRAAEAGLNACRQALCQVQAKEGTEAYLSQALSWIDQLLDQEEA